MKISITVDLTELVKRNPEVDEVTVILGEENAFDLEVERSEPPEAKNSKAKLIKEPKEEKTGRGKNKLTSSEIEDILDRNEAGESMSALAREFEVSSANLFYHKKRRAEEKGENKKSAEGREKQAEKDEEKQEETNPEGLKRYNYSCKCGFDFESTIIPGVVKCGKCGEVINVGEEN